MAKLLKNPARAAHSVQKLKVIFNKYPRTFDSCISSIFDKCPDMVITSWWPLEAKNTPQRLKMA